MDARFRLEPAEGIVSLDLDRRRFQPRFFALRLFEVLDLEAMSLCPAGVHAQQHIGPVLAFRTARAGMNFEIAVIGVRFAGEKRRAFLGRNFLAQLAQSFSASEMTC